MGLIPRDKRSTVFVVGVLMVVAMVLFVVGVWGLLDNAEQNKAAATRTESAQAPEASGDGARSAEDPADTSDEKQAKETSPESSTATPADDAKAASTSKNASSGTESSSAASGSAKNAASKGATKKPKPNKNSAAKPSSGSTTKAPTTLSVTITIDGSAGGGAISPSGQRLTLAKGSSVYDALKKTGAVINAKTSAMGTYIVSINSLAEKQHGSGSGWKYSVNGAYPGKSCNAYTLADGDTIVWRYFK